ncbi:hypothetical protein PQX77_002497 [Marasmius sp. AFHP31]|nr:hypothetical protein PQX77_002497 [Marasmius sp. AFHP31]
MPAHRKYTTKKQQAEALRRKYRKYYVANREAILARKQMRHLNQVDVLEELFLLESDFNVEIDLFGSTYMERVYSEYRSWNEVGLNLDNSPLEIPLMVCNLALETAAKISTALLHQFGAGREWNLSRRLIHRITIVRSLLQEMEVIVTRASAGVGIEGF